MSFQYPDPDKYTLEQWLNLVGADSPLVSLHKDYPNSERAPRLINGTVKTIRIQAGIAAYRLFFPTIVLEKTVVVQGTYFEALDGTFFWRFRLNDRSYYVPATQAEIISD